MANQRHLDLESRNYIEQALSKNLTFKEIVSVVQIVKNNVDTSLIAIVLIFQRVFVRG